MRILILCDLEGTAGVNMAHAGEVGVPTVFVSGDRAAVDEARRYVPDIEGVVVKEGLSRTGALTLSPTKARDLIREGALKAMGRIGEIAPYTISSPYVFATLRGGQGETQRARHRRVVSGALGGEVSRLSATGCWSRQHDHPTARVGISGHGREQYHAR